MPQLRQHGRVVGIGEDAGPVNHTAQAHPGHCRRTARHTGLSGLQAEVPLSRVASELNLDLGCNFLATQLIPFPLTSPVEELQHRKELSFWSFILLRILENKGFRL